VHCLGGPSIPFVSTEGRQVGLIETAYCRHGELATGDAVAGFMRQHVEQPVSVLARWIVTRQVISFEWCSETWIPWFQFALPEMKVRQDVGQVIRELMGAFDDYDLAMWFASPTPGFRTSPPLDAIDVEPSAVLHAARADRFIAMGSARIRRATERPLASSGRFSQY
jgi:hypothetical protein